MNGLRVIKFYYVNNIPIAFRIASLITYTIKRTVMVNLKYQITFQLSSYSIQRRLDFITNYLVFAAYASHPVNGISIKKCTKAQTLKTLKGFKHGDF